MTSPHDALAEALEAIKRNIYLYRIEHLTPDTLANAIEKSVDAALAAHRAGAPAPGALAELIARAEAVVSEVEDRGVHVASTGNGYTWAKDLLAALRAGNEDSKPPTKCAARRVHPYSSDYYIECRHRAGHDGPHYCDVEWTDDSPYALAALRAGSGDRITHGRHCICSACAMFDWTDPALVPCGMHGPDCPAVYAPLGAPGSLRAGSGSDDTKFLSNDHRAGSGDSEPDLLNPQVREARREERDAALNAAPVAAAHHETLREAELARIVRLLLRGASWADLKSDGSGVTLEAEARAALAAGWGSSTEKT